MIYLSTIGGYYEVAHSSAYLDGIDTIHDLCWVDKQFRHTNQGG